MKKRVIKISMIVTALSVLSGAAVYADQGNITASYLYTLSNFSGVVPYSWTNMAVDQSVDEVYVKAGGQVQVFNSQGMEIYTMNAGGELGYIYDMSVDDQGIIYALVNQDGSIVILRCNYRGETLSKFAIKNLPEKFSNFEPGRISVQKGQIYLASLPKMQVVVTDLEGVFKNGYDVTALLGITEDQTMDNGMVGFTVDREGNMMFTIPPIAKAYILNERGVSEFGRRGSTAGKFGVPGGIIHDASGKYILVADTLRCKILVFDNGLKFHYEFGFRSLRPDGLVGPMGLAVDSKNRLYVTQLRSRGISVFQLSVQ